MLDRNLNELLQELRVAITGVQILFAFLLGLAFTQRFSSLDPFDVTVYTITLLITALTTIVLIAPVAFHRLVFRRRQKDTLIMVADRLLLLGLGLLAAGHQLRRAADPRRRPGPVRRGLPAAAWWPSSAS